MELRIDPELKNLFRPLDSDEYEALEKLLLKEGCTHPLDTWNGVIIDGHNRYEICKKHGLDFKVTEHNFGCKEEAIEWMWETQSGRRNMSPAQRTEFALRMRSIIAARAKGNLATHTVDGYQGLQNSAKAVNTRQEIARMAGVSHDTVDKVSAVLNKAPDEVKNAMRQEEISVNSAYETTKLKPEEQQEIAERIRDGQSAKEVVKEVKMKAKNNQEADKPTGKPTIRTSEPITPVLCPKQEEHYRGGGTKEYRKDMEEIAQITAKFSDPNNVPETTLDMVKMEISENAKVYIKMLRRMMDIHKRIIYNGNAGIIAEMIQKEIIEEIIKIKESVENGEI